MYIVFIRKSWISSPSKHSLFMIRRLNYGWIWYCHNLRHNNSQICKFWNQQLYVQKLCLWDDQIQVNQHRSLRRGRLPALDAEEPKTRIRQLEGCALNHLVGSSAASGRQKRQNLIGSSWPSDVLLPPAEEPLICVSSIAIGRLRN